MYSIAKQLQLTQLFKYFQQNHLGSIHIKQGLQHQLIDYLNNVPQLTHLTSILELVVLASSFDYYDFQLNFAHLFQQFGISTVYQNEFNESEIQYILRVLNQMVEKQEPFPQILCGLQFTTQANSIIFKINPTARFLQIVEDLEASNKQWNSLKFQLDEENIILQLLTNTIRKIMFEHLSYYNDGEVQKMYQKLNSLDYQNYESNIIFEKLIELELKINNLSDQQVYKRFKTIAVAAFLFEYSKHGLIFPDMIKYLTIRRLSSVTTVLTCKANSSCLQDISRDPKVHDLIDINFNEKSHSKLEMMYPQLSLYKNVDQVIEQNLKMIYERRIEIKDQLMALFRLEKVMKLITKIQQLPSPQNTLPSFSALLSLKDYATQFLVIIPQKKKVIFISSFEKVQAKKNARMLLRMMVQNDIVLPEIICYLTYCWYKNRAPELILTTSIRIYNFLENDPTIKSLLKFYNVPDTDRYQILNTDILKIKLTVNSSEIDCIINRLEAIERDKYSLKKQLTLIFEQKPVQDLMEQLEECSNQYKLSNPPQLVCVAYQILLKIKSVLQQKNN